ncbi:MAG: hypothetical protein BWY91_01958 [bacterium ADurb.BinA028]|nr:MAG: hypothetical protein BWY91_01958 [bacterium ADurb.BinA028]
MPRTTSIPAPPAAPSTTPTDQPDPAACRAHAAASVDAPQPPEAPTTARTTPLALLPADPSMPASLACARPGPHPPPAALWMVGRMTKGMWTTQQARDPPMVILTPTAAPTPWPTDSTTPRTPPQPTDGRKRAPHHWPGPEGGRATAPAGGTTGAVWRAGTGGEGPVRTCSTPRGSMAILRLPSPKGKRYPIRNTRLACRPRHSPQAAPHAQVSRPTRTASATRAPSAAAWVIACAAWRNHRATPCGVPEAYAVSAPR